MIRVSVGRRNGKIVSFSAQGHADMGEYGKDIVCAAVSAVLQTALLGLTDRAGARVTARVDPGDMRVGLPPQLSGEQRGDADAILETMLLGLRAMEPNGGLRIVEREV